MTQAQVLAAINSPTAVNGTGGFTAAGGTVGGAPAAITVAAAGLNGGVPVTVNTIVATDTAAQVATKINTALAGATGGADGISAQVVGGQIVMNSALADAVTLGRRRRNVDRHRLCGRQSQLDCRHRAARHARRHLRRVGSSGS